MFLGISHFTGECAIEKHSWPPWSLIGRVHVRHFGFFSAPVRWTEFDETWQAARTQHPLHVLSFWGPIGTPRWPPWPLIDSYIFDYIYLESLTEFYETWQEASTFVHAFHTYPLLNQFCDILADWTRHVLTGQISPATIPSTMDNNCVKNYPHSSYLSKVIIFAMCKPWPWQYDSEWKAQYNCVKADMKSYIPLETTAIFFLANLFLKQGISSEYVMVDFICMG